MNESLAAKQEAALAELESVNPPEVIEANNQMVAQSQKKNDPIIATGDVVGIIPRNIDEAWRLSQAFVRAGMVPDSYEGKNAEETTAKIMIGVLKGLEVGLAPVSAISTIMIVNKRPSIWGDGAVALVQKTGLMKLFKETHEGEELKDDWKAVCTVQRVGHDIESREFTWAQAKAAGLTNKGPWRQYPKRMLQMRARAWALRDNFSDCLHGLAIAEEVKDFEITEKKIADTSSLEDTDEQ